MLYEEFYKEVTKKSPKDPKKRKYIRIECRRCKKILEIDKRDFKTHKGYCVSCRNYAREGYILTNEDEIYISKSGLRFKGKKIICPICKAERIVVMNASKKRTGYCRHCFGKGTAKKKTIREIQNHIRENVKINENGCWIWQNGLNRAGYGKCKINGRQWTSHRLSYSVFNEPIPKKAFVLHKCPGGGNPACCCPDHLKIGDAKENANDRKKDGRDMTIGEKNWNSKLTENQVIEIKRRLISGEVGANLAIEFGLSRTHVYSIKHGKSWSHVPWPDEAKQIDS